MVFNTPIIIILYHIIVYISPAYAYQLSSYTIPDALRHMPAEIICAKFKQEEQSIYLSLPKGYLQSALHYYKDMHRSRISRHTQHYKRIHTALIFWNYVCQLKQTLVELHHTTLHFNFQQLNSEADLIAKTLVQTMYQLSHTYKVHTFQRFHNFLINMNIKKRGLCHHYTDDIFQSLDALSVSSLDHHRIISKENTRREHNAIAITAHNQKINTGIVIDPWRNSSRPFWINVSNDTYSWHKLSE